MDMVNRLHLKAILRGSCSPNFTETSRTHRALFIACTTLKTNEADFLISFIYRMHALHLLQKC